MKSYLDFEGMRAFPDVTCAGVSVRGLAYRNATPPDSPFHRLLVFEKTRQGEGARFDVPILPDALREAGGLLGKHPEREQVEKAVAVAIGLELQKRRQSGTSMSGERILVPLRGRHFVPGIGRSFASLRRA